MSKLQVKQEIFQKAIERADLTETQIANLNRLHASAATKKSSISMEIQKIPLPMLHSLLDDSRLTSNQRTQIAMQVYGMTKAEDVDREEIYNTSVANPVEFGSTLILLGGQSPNAEFFLNDRWYPVILQIQFLEDHDRHITRSVIIQIQLSLCDTSFCFRYHVFYDFFLDESGRVTELTVLDVLRKFNLRRLRSVPVDFNLKLFRAERTSRDQGKQALVTGPVLVNESHHWWSRIESRALGTPESPRKVVIEPELEVQEGNRYYHSSGGHDGEGVTRLPFVRVFSLETKRYVYADVDDVVEYEYDEDAMNRLHLPEGMRAVLGKVFATTPEQLFGDLIRGKHGGAVILASGKPGVGKTLTAEVYAEQTQRPLYVLELGELGTNAAQVEENLQRVFTRVSRWNAVLQFDECEIFLSKRDSDLERSAIVGIFLRLLDYYRGILFLTTNRPEVLDYAILSRVMLHLEYPDLDAPSREAIWKTMFQEAGLELMGNDFTSLSEVELNGRQIRNLTRLARIIHPERTITLEQLREVLRFGVL